MKKILLIASLILMTALTQNVSLATDVNFVYINGSNNNNEKMKRWFEKGVRKLHPTMEKTFEKDERVRQLMLSKDSLNIIKEPTIFFWGDESKNDLEFVNNQLNLSKILSPTVAYHVQSLITQYLHDAIWVQKPHHMAPIVKSLNETVKEKYNKGETVVLYGYSAGTFVTYEYLFNTLPYINLQELSKALSTSKETQEFVANNPKQDTCISALHEGGIGTVTSNGKLVFNSNDKLLKEHYQNLDEVTQRFCSPKGAVRGIVNYASPLVLFYSDLADADYELTYYNKLLLKYIMENGLFFLTVNFREDPLGFPSSRNLTYEEMENILNTEFKNPSGFVFDDSGVKSWRPFFLAHTSYWTAKKQFSKAVVESFVNGYRYQYDPQYREKIQKKGKRYEIL